MTSFNSYRRIGNFVIEIKLDAVSEDLRTTCIVYYGLPNKDITKIYTLSKGNQEAKIDIHSKNRNYVISGTLSLHSRYVGSSEMVNIYARLAYGKDGELLNYEGVLARIDTIKGNVLENTDEFPNISDLYMHPNLLDEGESKSNESFEEEEASPVTDENNDYEFVVVKEEENTEIDAPVGEDLDGYQSLFPYLNLNHWVKVKADNYPNIFIQYTPLIYSNDKNNVFFELLKYGKNTYPDNDEAYIFYNKTICEYWIENKEIYWSDTTTEIGNYDLNVALTPQTDSVDNTAILYESIDDIPTPFDYFPSIYDDLCDFLSHTKGNLAANKEFEQYLYNILIDSEKVPFSKREALILTLESYLYNVDELLTQLNRKRKVLEILKDRKSDLKKIISQISYLESIKIKSKKFKFDKDNLWQNYFLMVTTNELDANYSIELTKIIVVTHIIERWSSYNRFNPDVNTSNVVPVVYKEIVNANIILSQDAFRKINPTVLKSANPNWVAPFAIGELEMVQYKLDKYETGEVAHIENIIKGEVKTITKRTLVNQYESTTSSNEDTKQFSKQNGDTITDLAVEIRKTLANITETTSYKDLDIDYSSTPVAKKSGTITRTFTNTPLNTANNTEIADNNKLVKQILQSTIDRITEKVAIKRMTSTNSENEETSSSTFDNKKGEANIISVYRWLNKRYKITLKQLENRLILEFKLRQPADNYKKLQLSLNGMTLEQKFMPNQIGLHSFMDLKTEDEANSSTNSATHTPVETLNMMKAFKVTKEATKKISYVNYVSYYQIDTIDTPPENNIYVAEVLHAGASSAKVVLPQDYGAEEATIAVIGLKSGDSTSVVIGNQVLQISENGYQTINFTSKLNGEIIIMLLSTNDDMTSIDDVSVAVQIKCEIDSKILNDWRIKTFAKIKLAYQDWSNAYYEMESRFAKENEAANTLIFRNIEKSELRKLSNELLFSIVPRIEYPNNETEIYQFSYSKFFSKTLDWTDMTYSFDDTPTEFSYQLQGRNDSLRPFLQASTAHIFIPVQKNWSYHLLYFMATGEIWKIPNPFVPIYLEDVDIVYQIKKSTETKQKTKKQREWTVILPTTMQIAQDKDELIDQLKS